MKKKLLIPLSVIVLAVLAVLFLYPPYKSLKSADELLSSGRYTEAFPVYGSVIKEPRTPFFRDRAETGLAGCAEAALAAGDESFIEFTAAQETVRPAGETALARFDRALSGLQTIRADRLAAEEAERLALLKQQNEEAAVRTAQSTVEPIGLLLSRAAEDEAAVRARQAERVNAFENALLAHDHLLALSVAEQMESEEARGQFRAKAEAAHEQDIPQLRAFWQDRLGAGVWYTALLTDTLCMQGDARYAGESMPAADSIFAGDFGVLLLREGVPSFYGDTLGADKQIAGMHDIVSGSVGMNHALLVHSDGTVSAVGAKQYQKAAIEEWHDIVRVAAGAFHSVGLDRTGHVAAVGLNTDLQCDTALWEGVTAVEAGMRHTVGLLADGHVVATGDNSFGQCDVSGWTDIIAIACGPNHTVGLKSDGHVVATGDNGAGQCEVGGWERVLAVKAGMWHTVALLQDGRVIACGANDNRQCDTDSLRAFTVTEYPLSSANVRGESSEYVYEGSEQDGPWVYYSAQGAVSVSLDDSYQLVATRADLYCTAGVYPTGILAGGGDQPARGTIPGTTLAVQNRAVFAINGDYFTFGYNPDGVQIRRGTVFKNEISDKKKSLGFAFWPDNSMRVVDPMQTDADALLALGIRDSWVFGPLLILNGEAQDISYSPLSYNDVTLRSAIGSICPCHHVALSCGRGTLAEVTQLFLDYGCDIAYNLDGGRSVWMTFMGKRINRTVFSKSGTRNLTDMVGFLQSDLVK